MYGRDFVAEMNESNHINSSSTTSIGVTHISHSESNTSPSATPTIESSFTPSSSSDAFGPDGIDINNPFADIYVPQASTGTTSPFTHDLEPTNSEAAGDVDHGEVNDSLPQNFSLGRFEELYSASSEFTSGFGDIDHNNIVINGVPVIDPSDWTSWHQPESQSRRRTPHGRTSPELRTVPRRRVSNPSLSLSTNQRVDLNVRDMLREMIMSAILSETNTVDERITLLEDCRYSAMSSELGIPFREILSEKMEPFGVPALMYELTSCQPLWTRPPDSLEAVAYPDLGTGLEMVQYLIENWQDTPTAGNMGNLSWIVRTGCLKRSEEDSGNRLYQTIRPFMTDSRSKQDEDAKYEIIVTALDGQRVISEEIGFKVIVSLPRARYCLSQLKDLDNSNSTTSLHQTNLGLSSLQSGRKPLPPVPKPTSIVVEFLAARHAWRLKLGRNSLELELVDGPSGYLQVEEGDYPRFIAPLKVDAVVEVVGSQADNESTTSSAPQTQNKFFLPRAELKPLSVSGRGAHSTRLSSCFYAAPDERNAIYGFDDPRLLQDDGTLLLEICVRLGSYPHTHPPSPSPLPLDLTFGPELLSQYKLMEAERKEKEEKVHKTLMPLPQVISTTGINVTNQTRYSARNSEESVKNDVPPDAGPINTHRLDQIDDDYDDLYISSDGENNTSRDQHNKGEDLDDWEEVSTMDELSDNENKDGTWVKAGWEGKQKEV